MSRQIIIAVLLLFCFSIGQASEYKLLFKETDIPTNSDKSDKHAYCVISVDECLNKAKFKQLICQVIKDENLSNQTSLIISVYYKLSKYVLGGLDFMEFDPPINTSQGIYIGSYSWPGRPKSKPDLIISSKKDCTKPAPPQRISFNHATQCKELKMIPKEGLDNQETK
jgi:hypothetical protein